MAKLRIQQLPPCTGRTLFIGDVHGCLKELKKLLKKFDPEPEDRIVFVGDLVNTGPDSHGVMKLARKLSAKCVLGNHEQRLLRAKKSKNPAHLKVKDRPTYESLTKKDWKWMNSWPHVIDIPSLKVLVVHGGFQPGLKWKSQEADVVTRIQVLASGRYPARRSEAPNGIPWADSWKGPQHVIYGHTPRPKPLLHPHATGLDTGCVYGFELTGLSLPDFKFYKVRAKRPYSDD